MKLTSVLLTLTGILFTVFLIRLLSLTSVWQSLLSQPWWVYAVISGIAVSGFMSIKTAIEEKNEEKAPVFR